ncbi:SAM-dependent methyltransferase [Virgibacillus indicus]|uniref:SAM-dependent methyltransferase n=1 Tax=Virgibacillus indicus TaxID=2024554 RepID=A0A265NCZ9_9BACI|nr:class I SAM-dependent methyltransferase [Virgibacillus indicus]OZU89908.1 SAM-dependent methyltransferase [Virgibacillus indicus]
MAYQQMAYLYDKLMEEAPYDQWLNFTLEAFRNHGKNINTVADLGCGTGVITSRLANEGYRLTGVDYSADMLTYAEHTANEQNVSVQWLKQDLRELQGLENFDAAVSYCDVINYITAEAELEGAFNNIANILKAGGLFLFDVHSLFHVQHNFINQTFADVMEDTSYIWFCMEGDHLGEMYHDLTFFSLDGDKYSRFDEFHHQRTYPITFYIELLKKAGFENIKVYADFSTKEETIQEEAERIFFRATKRSG